MKTFKFLKLSLLIALLFGVGTVFSQPVINPINILMPPVATDCGEYDIDLNVQQYINVANISMTLDISSLYFAGAYTGITMNTTAWPALINAITYVNPAGSLKVSWSSDPFPANAITLPDNTVLFTLHFDVNGLWGTSHDLAWDDVLTIDCELSGPNGYPIYPDYWNDLHWDIQDQLALSHTKVDFECPTGQMGSIDLTVHGGFPPYTYQWTGTVVQPPNPNCSYPAFPGATTQDLINLYPGTYCVTVTDADFCVVTQYCVTINQLPIPGPGEVGNPVPIASTVECLADVAPPVLPVVEDYCGVLLQPIGPPVYDDSNFDGCEGTITYTYTYNSCLNQVYVWTYTYTVEHSTPPAEVGGPVEIASTVECAVDAVAPGTVYQAGFAGDFDPVNWTLINLGGVDGTVDVTGAPASITLTGGNNGLEGITLYETIIPINGTVAFNWNYTTTDIPGYDAFGYALNGVYYALTFAPGGGSFSMNVTQGATFGFLVYTVDGLFGPGVAITDAFLFKSPALPVVADICGEILSPVGPVISGTYAGCEGTIIYTYTYTDCAGLDFVWDYTYTILRVTPPAEVGGPVPIASTVECFTDIVVPTLPIFEDVCGIVITPTGPVMSGTYVDCEGTVIYTYTYTDCAGLSTDWVYTYTVDDTQNPTITCPADVTEYMNAGCTAINVDLGVPVVGDNCDPNPMYYNDAPSVFPEGLTVVTWTVVDCAGNSATCTQNVWVIRNILSGTLVYNNILPFGPNKIMNNVEITLYDAAMIPLATSVTDFLGNYSFPNLCAGAYYVEITNNNKPAGGVNTTDAGQVLTYGFSPYPIECVRWLAGDANGINFINIADVGKIVNEFVYDAGFAPNKADWNYYWAGCTHPNNTTYPALPMSIVIGGGNAVGNIFAQCTGDFNGNFSPGVMKSESENLTLDYGKNMLVEANAEIELPVLAGMDMEVGAVSLILNFPSNEAEITGVFLSSNPSSPLQYNVKGDELRIGWYSLAPVWLNKGESLITLQLKLKGETSAEGIQFSLAADPLNELTDGNFNVISAALLIIEVPSTSALGAFDRFSAESIEFSNHPNPFKGTTALNYNIPFEGKVVIEVYDLLGTLVKTVVNENQAAGQYSLQLNANSLQPGIYTAVLKLNSADHEVMIRAIKMINK